MTTTRTTRQQTIYLQVGIILVILVAIFWVFKLLGVFDPAGPSIHTVTYRVEGSAGTTTITYTQADGKSTKPFDEKPTWQKLIKFNKSTTVVLTATNPTQTGTLKCRILLDGKDWKENAVAAPGDRVSCAGITP